MASYKVAQDVEADDKLLGPFSFRQFIYLIIAVMCGILAWGLAQVFIPLAVIPVPIILFFLAIALPLRKDQPMEVYFAAIVSYYIKPKRRLWEPDGVQSLVEITVPVDNESQRTKELSASETERRLEYLAVLADSQGWSVRNAAAPPAYNSPVNRAIYHEAQNEQDSFDEASAVSQSFSTMIDQSDEARRAAIMQRMHNPQPVAAPAAPSPSPAQPIAQVVAQPVPVQPANSQVASPPSSVSPAPGVQSTTAPNTLIQPSPQQVTSDEDLTVSFNPYPESMRQRVLPTSAESPQPTAQPQPAHQAPAEATPEPAPEPDNSTSEIQVSADIINLANNTDLTVETIAREAHRIQEKSQDSEEVVISLH